MPDSEWRPFLEQWSREWLESGADELEEVPPALRASGWLGYQPATDGQIAAAEARLGIALPPSYRSFLLTTNGWTLTSPAIFRLWPVEQVDWFRVRNREWIEGFTGGYLHGGWEPPADAEIHDLPHVLEVSDVGDEAVLLLNPRAVVDGEWEAWFFANWNPGATRYPSFRALMEAERERFRFVLRPAPSP